MGYMEGLLGGFVGRKREVEQENIRQADLANQREGKIFEALLSSPDPEIQSLAAAGLLESANPKNRKKGFRGWLGEMEQSPTLGRVRQLIDQPVQTGPGELPTLAHTEYPSIATPPPSLGNAPAGMAAESLTQPGAAPPPNMPTAPRPQPKAIPATVGKPPTFGPRKVFASPEDLSLQKARGDARGEVEGDVAGLVAAGFSQAEAADIIKQERLKRATGATGTQSIAGEIVGADGKTTPAFGVFDRQRGVYLDPATQQPIQGFRPRTSTGSTSMGADREAIARELYGRPFAQLSQQEQGAVNKQAITRAGTMAEERGLGTGRAKIATELASPIGPAAAAQYNVSPTTTLGQLQNLIGLNDAQKDRVYALSQIDVTLDEIEQMIPKVFPNVAPGMSGALKTALSLGAQRLAGDADLAALDAAIEGSLAQVAQLSGQPGSRLSDNDIKMARAELANLTPQLFGGDTIHTARARVGVLRKLFDRAQGSIPTTLPAGVGAPPPQGAAARPGAPAAAVAAPPPARSNASGPAGYFVNDAGELIKR